MLNQSHVSRKKEAHLNICLSRLTICLRPHCTGHSCCLLPSAADIEVCRHQLKDHRPWLRGSDTVVVTPVEADGRPCAGRLKALCTVPYTKICTRIKSTHCSQQSVQFYALENLPCEGLYHSDESHKDENWELKSERQIFQEGSEKTTDPFPDAYQRLRNKHHNRDRNGLEQMVRVRSQMIVSVKTSMSSTEPLKINKPWKTKLPIVASFMNSLHFHVAWWTLHTTWFNTEVIE